MITRPARATSPQRRATRVGGLPLLLLGCAMLVSCDGKVSPLTAPLASDRVVNAGAWVVLTNTDLQRLPEAVRLAAGKTADASVAPLTLGGGSLAPTTLALAIGEGSATITKSQDIALTYPISSPAVPLALVADGRAACGLSWQAKGGSLTLTLRVGRTSTGGVDVVLAANPKLVLSNAALTDTNSCLAGSNLAGNLAEHLRVAAEGSLAARYVKAARDTLQTVIPPSLEGAVQVEATEAGAPITLSMQSRYRQGSAEKAEPQASLLHHNGSFAAIGLNVGLDVTRHPCAVEAPAPQLSVQALPVKAPTVTIGAKVLRRAVVLDRALLAHLGWAAARSGYLCRGRARGVEKQLPAHWASEALPALGNLVEAGAVGARFWPGKPPSVRVINLKQGGGIEWQLPEAALEMTAPVAGVELVVLRVEGNFRVVMRPQTAAGVGFSIVSTSVDSAVVSSPLLPQTATAAGPGLGAAVDAALKGIFAGSLGLAPGVAGAGAGAGGAVIVGSSRVADQLWLWLEGGGLPPLP